MKNILYTIVISVFILFAFSCGNSTSNQSTESHAHEDGTVHEGAKHNETNESKPEQESFVVESDSLDTHSHDDHDHEHSHDHQH